MQVLVGRRFDPNRGLTTTKTVDKRLLSMSIMRAAPGFVKIQMLFGILQRSRAGLLKSRRSRLAAYAFVVLRPHEALAHAFENASSPRTRALNRRKPRQWRLLRGPGVSGHSLAIGRRGRDNFGYITFSLTPYPLTVADPGPYQVLSSAHGARSP